jgi:hypothetical protein
MSPGEEILPEVDRAFHATETSRAASQTPFPISGICEICGLIFLFPSTLRSRAGFDDGLFQNQNGEIYFFKGRAEG